VALAVAFCSLVTFAVPSLAEGQKEIIISAGKRTSAIIDFRSPEEN
jgi:hypothetical protein